MTMRLWKVVLLVDVALVLGLGGGYLWWAREVRQLRQELETTREAAQPRAVAGGSWTARGIVRLVQRDPGVVWLTHEDIPDLMEGMTMPFHAASEKLLEGLSPGDPVRFTLKAQDGRLLVTAIKKEGSP
jgi:Cu/Ag efflux protein CusF